jgi:hypothetical protein
MLQGGYLMKIQIFHSTQSYLIYNVVRGSKDTQELWSIEEEQ